MTGAIDGAAPAPVLDEAGRQGVKVLAYDRLIRNSAHVDHYATFDNFQVGVLQARDIEQRLQPLLVDRSNWRATLVDSGSYMDGQV